jgi:hypothetical protein
MRLTSWCMELVGEEDEDGGRENRSMPAFILELQPEPWGDSAISWALVSNQDEISMPWGDFGL